MGAWGAGPLENDDAMDFIGEFEEEPEVEGLLEAFDAVTETDDVEAADAAAAIAAAEIVAAMRGKGTPRLPKSILAWAKEQTADADLLEAARAAVEAASTSEMRDLWEDADEADQWRANLKSLNSRLG